MTGAYSIGKEDERILITHLPNRKKPCLAVQIGNCIYKVASFDSEETTDWFIEIYEELYGLYEKEVEE